MAGLTADDFEYLTEVVQQARKPWPVHWKPWTLAGYWHPIGLLSPQKAANLAVALPAHMPLISDGDHWVWHAAHCTASERSDVLQGIARHLRSTGELRGWRDETHACWGWREDAWPYEDPALFVLERAAFRYFGLRSHASHVHGISENGRMWCGRRALDKATDPGMLDNLAAGGLPVDEDPAQCAVREIFEEAGLTCLLQDLSCHAGEVITEREEAQGWHSERIFLYSVLVTDDQQPANRDGEVMDFLCLDSRDVLRRMRAGEFTHDAACAIAKSTLLGDLSRFT